MQDRVVVQKAHAEMVMIVCVVQHEDGKNPIHTLQSPQSYLMILRELVLVVLLRAYSRLAHREDEVPRRRIRDLSVSQWHRLARYWQDRIPQQSKNELLVAELRSRMIANLSIMDRCCNEDEYQT